MPDRKSMIDDGDDDKCGGWGDAMGEVKLKLE